MPEILEATYGYLRQIPNLDDKDPIEVPPSLLQAIKIAKVEAKKEQECKLSTSSSAPCMLTRTTSTRVTDQGPEVPHYQPIQ